MRLVSSGLLVMLSIYGHSQVLPSFKSLRYDEDYSMSKSDTTIPWYRKMKYKSLSKKTNTYLSMGGELRYQYFYIRNENWELLLKIKTGLY